jgi:putative acetyltransferase
MDACFRIRPAQWPADVGAIRALWHEYEASMPYSLCFQGFESELAGLPGTYAEPHGLVLLAETQRPEKSIVGAIAFRPLAPTGLKPGDRTPVCEMKRLYVTPNARGESLGLRLCEQLMDHARRAGYRSMKLDTDTTSMSRALVLYKALGFAEIERYNDDPMADTVWLGSEL